MKLFLKPVVCLALCMSVCTGSVLAKDVDHQQALLGLNELRAQHGLVPLGWSRRLEKAAREHAKDMQHRGFFSHQGSNGSRVGDRVRKRGYRWCAVAENIAKGQPSLLSVMSSWRGSPGHRKNLLHGQVSEFALVRAEGNIWVMVLARPGCRG